MRFARSIFGPRQLSVAAHRAAVILGAVAALGAAAILGGCATDDVDGGAQFEASSGTTRAALDVPEGEAASIGSYALSIVTPEAGADGAESAEIITGEREGTVTGLWTDDVTGDQAVDVIVAMSSAGSGSYGTCHVYAASGSGFTRVELAPLSEGQRDGFMGHDSFEVVDGVLFRTFPVYASGDPNARPTGGVLGYRYDFENGAWVEP